MQQRLRALLSTLVVLAIVFVTAWFVYNSLTFRITGTNPRTNSVATVSPFFKINFNKPLSPKGLSITSRPNIINTYSVNGGTLNIVLDFPLVANQTYAINLEKVYSTGGKEILNKSFSFQPSYVAESSLPKDQQQALLSYQQKYNQILQNSGLPQYLPFVGGGLAFKVDYKIIYKNELPTITIVITAPSDTGRREALAWIQSLGYNPDKYQIQYFTAKVSS